MTTFNKTLKNYIDKVINSDIDYRNSNLIELDFQKKSGSIKSRGDMYFYLNSRRVYVKVQKSSMYDDFKIIINKFQDEMKKDDWNLFYKEVSKMKIRTQREDINNRVRLFGIIWINDEQFEMY